jgi:hypothetical protein
MAIDFVRLTELRQAAKEERERRTKLSSSGRTATTSPTSRRVRCSPCGFE